LGVVLRPRDTFAAVAADPRWAGTLAVSTAAAAIAAALVYATGVGQQALVDQWERTALAFGQPVDDARYAELMELSGYGPIYGVAGSMVYGPCVALVVAAAAFLVLPARPRPAFRQVLAVAVHAGIVLALRVIFAAPVTYIRETTASATSVGALFPLLDEGTAAARFLGLVDMFLLWWVVLLGVGMGILYRRSAGRLAMAFLGAYLIVAAALAAMMAFLGEPA
jgi:hypothetical protein